MPSSASTPTSAPSPLRMDWFIWGPAALLDLMGFFQGVAPAVITAELMRNFQIHAWCRTIYPVPFPEWSIWGP